MSSREKDLYEELACVIQEYFALAKVSVNDVISLERDDITFFFEGHYSEGV